MKYQILQPDPSIFENQHKAGDSLVPLGIKLNVLKEIKYPDEGGIYCYFEGMPFPRKGLPFPDALYANDTVKRVMMFFVMTLSARGVFSLPFLIMRVKTLEKILVHWNRIGDYLLSPYYFKRERYCDLCRELRTFITIFLSNIGIAPDVADHTAKIFTTLLEYDDAYRLRVSDILAELKAEEWSKMPQKAIKKAIGIYSRREHAGGVTDKFMAFGRIFSMILYVPKVKKAFIHAFRLVSYDKMILDEADRYHTLVWKAYDFQGMNDDERLAKWHTYHPTEADYPKVIELVTKK